MISVRSWNLPYSESNETSRRGSTYESPLYDAVLPMSNWNSGTCLHGSSEVP